MKRRARIYEVVLQSEDGETLSEKVRSFWSPEFKEAIKEVAAVQAWWHSDKRLNFAPIELVGMEFEDEITATAGAPA